MYKRAALKGDRLVLPSCCRRAAHQQWLCCSAFHRHRPSAAESSTHTEPRQRRPADSSFLSSRFHDASRLQQRIGRRHRFTRCSQLYRAAASRVRTACSGIFANGQSFFQLPRHDLRRRRPQTDPSTGRQPGIFITLKPTKIEN